MPEPFDPELTPLEASLARLVPRAEGLSRERMLFEAGRSRARPGRLWPALTGLSSLAALVLAGVLLTRSPTVIVEERIVVRVKDVTPAPPPPPAPTTEPVAEEPDTPGDTAPPQNEYLRLRQGMLHWGMDALPPPAASAATESPLMMPADLLARGQPRGVLRLWP